MKQRIINFFLRNVLKVVIPEDVIQNDKQGNVYLGGIKITDQELRSLVAEAKALENMRIWSIMNETIKQLAYEKGWKNSTSLEHLNTAKTEYHVLDLQQSIIKTIKSKAK